MTIREAYINTLRLIKKHKAPALYVEDFVHLFYNAQVNKFSFLKGLYERNQQLSDDLQPLLGHVIINLDPNIPYPISLSKIDGSPYILFDNFRAYGATGGNSPSVNVYTTLNGSLQYQEYRRDFHLYWPSTTTHVDNVLNNYMVSLYCTNDVFDTMIAGNIQEGKYLGIKSNYSNSANKIRDYRYGGNNVSLEYGFDLGFDYAGKTIGVNNNPIYFTWDNDRKMWKRVVMETYKIINDNTISIYAPPEYWYLLDVTTHIKRYNNVECIDDTEDNTDTVDTVTQGLGVEINANINNVHGTSLLKNKSNKSFSEKYSCKRLTSDTYNGRLNNVYLEAHHNKPYFKEAFDSITVYPQFEIEYCNIEEKDFVILKKIEVLYLREPRKYYITDSDLEGIDKTDVLPYPETLCKELVDSTVKLVLEGDMDERLRTQPVVNDTVIGRTEGLQRK